ncbi:MAG: VOC family protein [Zetaproteobacteria bacterium]|nr:VOC family protein [Zetaproteobacteria bacterium]
MEPRISIITLGVQDLAQAKNFYTQLGFIPAQNPSAEIVFFKNWGTCLALYPLHKLAEDIGITQCAPGSGITLAHNVREKSSVDTILQAAAAHGGKIVKPAQDAFWGGYSGYFSDPDGYYWEIAWGAFDINLDGSLHIP